MKIKEEKPIFFKTFAIVLLILLINIAFFTYNSRESINLNKGLTGFSVNEVISDNNAKINPLAKILIIVQWSFLGFILIFTATRDKKLKKQNIELESIKINPSKQQTDLDKLYTILRERKQIKVKNISKLFKVEYEVSLEWAKILESGNLAEIDYPMFGSPVLNFKTEKNKEEGNKENQNKDTQTDKKQNLNEEQLKTNNQIKTKKSKSLFILFIIILGFAAYPLYWLYNNNWNYTLIPQNKPVLITIGIFSFFTFIFLITLIKRIFKRNKKEDPKTKEITEEKQIEIKNNSKKIKKQVKSKTKINSKTNLQKPKNQKKGKPKKKK